MQNQNPLDPLDTNQFTQELVEFASVGQQVDMNINIQTLIALQQTPAATAAPDRIGPNVTIAGKAASLSDAIRNPLLGACLLPRRQRPASRFPALPARPPIPAPWRPTPERKASPGTGAATTA